MKNAAFSLPAKKQTNKQTNKDKNGRFGRAARHFHRTNHDLAMIVFCPQLYRFLNSFLVNSSFYNSLIVYTEHF